VVASSTITVEGMVGKAGNRCSKIPDHLGADGLVIWELEEVTSQLTYVAAKLQRVASHSNAKQ
jgi:hypothetical protein